MLYYFKHAKHSQNSKKQSEHYMVVTKMKSSQRLPQKYRCRADISHGKKHVLSASS